MTIKTKKYQIPTNTYIMIGMKHLLRLWWWAWFVPVAIIILFALLGWVWWGLGIAVVLSALYVLFVYIQFFGLTQMEQGKMLFGKYTYDIDSRQILMMINAKEGMPVTWDKIQQVQKRKDAYILFLSKVQFLYFPFDIFRTENDIKFFEIILQRKNFLPATVKPAKAEKTETKA